MTGEDDERAIRALVDEWKRATSEGDLPRILALMTDDARFLQSGREPLDKAGFEREFRASIGVLRIAYDAVVEELRVDGDHAFTITRLAVRVTRIATGETSRAQGRTLTVFRRSPSGAWQLARDANTLSAVD